MAGIRVPQHNIFKINTSKMQYNKWNLKISEKDAFNLDEIIPLFQGESIRAISDILKIAENKKDFTKYILALVIDKKQHFTRATSKKGFFVNGIKFKRFVGTTGGLKGDTVLFVAENIYEVLYERSECGRDKNLEIVPAKLEAYRALFFSASQKIPNPRNILVVKDCLTKFKDTVINIDDSNDIEPKMKILEDIELENNCSDGFSICSIEYMKSIAGQLHLDYVPSGVCLRGAWFKGMLYPFPINEFIEEFNNGNYMIKDIWGNMIDIRDVDIVTTESSLKLWKAYNSIEHYLSECKKYNFNFSVTKIAPKKLEDERELNYQYLQSYDFSDKDIEELCKPTVNYLKNSMCGDYESTIEFLGITGDLNDNSWQQALRTNKYMLKDPYVVDSVHRLIKKKINNAKIGKLLVDGNYQLASGDPFALMQSMCGLEVTGILKENECYSNYWNNKESKEICIFRSPMTSHNNIRKCNINNSSDANKWYRYMYNIMIINAWDSFMIASNGCDFDGDLLYSTDNDVLLKRYIKLPAIQCIQRTVAKTIPTEEDIKLSNLNGMSNKVGSITNKVTNMIEVRSKFDVGSKEYDIMTYRMACGQLYQQNELDKIKGIDFKPMPNYWHNIKSCTTDEQRLLCSDKKPYFFIYIYDYVKKEYVDYVKSVENKCIRMFGKTLDELLNSNERTDDENTFIFWYNKDMTIGFGECSMNKICWYIEKEFDGYKSHLKTNGLFDYNILKTTRRCSEKHRQELFLLMQEYIEHIKKFKTKTTMLKSNTNDENIKTEDMSSENMNNSREFFKETFKNKAIEICPDDNERLNIVLDMCYGIKNNKQFCWDVVGDLIIGRLEELKIESNNE